MKVTHTITPRETTLEDVWAWVNSQGLDPAKVTVTGGHLTYERPETDEEYVRRMQNNARGAYAARKAVRARYIEYFGDTPPSAVDIGEDPAPRPFVELGEALGHPGG